MDVVRHPQAQAGVPARAVKDEDDLLAWPGADCAGKGGELRLEVGDADAGRQVEDGAPAGRVDDADDAAGPQSDGARRRWAAGRSTPRPVGAAASSQCGARRSPSRSTRAPGKELATSPEGWSWVFLDSSPAIRRVTHNCAVEI